MKTKRKSRLAMGLVILLLGVFSLTSIGLAAYSTGKSRVKTQVRLYKTKKKRAKSYVEGATVSLYSKAGELAQRGTSSVRWGKMLFSNVGKGTYYVTCSKAGYVNASNPSKTVYKTGYSKVKSNKSKKTISKICKLKIAS